MGDTPLAVGAEILAELFMERGIAVDAVENAIRHGNDLLLVHSNALDAIIGMLGEEVAPRALLVRMSTRNSHDDQQKNACTSAAVMESWPQPAHKVDMPPS